MSGARKVFDVAIVGASLAGSAAAADLGRAGMRVALIDSREFPRRKACGEGLSFQGLRRLESLGVSVQHLAHHPIDGYRIRVGSKEATIELSSRQPSGTGGIGISRSALDSAVLEKAASFKSVELFERSSVRFVSQGADKCSVSLANGDRLESRFIIDASGARRSTAVSSEGRSPLRRYGSSCHFSLARGSLPAEVFICVGNGYELFVTPIGERLLNVALLGAKRSFSAGAAASIRRSAVEMLRARFDTDLRQEDDWMFVGPVGNRRRSSSRGRIFYAGDACEQFDPIGGMGMTHAILSGSEAAHSLAAVLQGACSLAQSRASYASRRAEIAKPLRGFTRLTYFMLVTLGQSGIGSMLRSSPIAAHVSRAVHQADSRALTKLSGKLIAFAGL